MARNEERRKATRALQSERRKAERRIKELRAAAKAEKNIALKKAMQRKAKNLKSMVTRWSAPGKVRSSTLKQIKGAVSRFAIRTQNRESAKSGNEFFKSEMRLALDGVSTVFGKGEAGRSNVKFFFNYYIKDWQGRPGLDRIAAIQSAHPGVSVLELFNAAMQGDEFRGIMSFEEYLATRLSIDTFDIDTRGEAFNRAAHEVYDTLSSPEQREMSRGYAAYTASFGG